MTGYRRTVSDLSPPRPPAFCWVWKGQPLPKQPRQLRLLRHWRSRNFHAWARHSVPPRAAKDAPTYHPRRVGKPSFLGRTRKSSGFSGANLASLPRSCARPAGFLTATVSGRKACNCHPDRAVGPDIRHCSDVRHPDSRLGVGGGVGRGDGRTTCCLGCSFFSFSLRVTAGRLGEPRLRTHADSPASNHALRSQPVPQAHHRTLYTFYRRSWSFSGATIRGATQCFPHRSSQAPPPPSRLRLPAIPTPANGRFSTCDPRLNPDPVYSSFHPVFLGGQVTFRPRFFRPRKSLGGSGQPHEKLNAPFQLHTQKLVCELRLCKVLLQAAKLMSCSVAFRRPLVLQ